MIKHWYFASVNRPLPDETSFNVRFQLSRPVMGEQSVCAYVDGPAGG